MKLNTDPQVPIVFSKYPARLQPKFAKLRKLLIQSAQELQLDELHETLKWGEPSYLTKHGSTIRIGYSSKEPGKYAVYFTCTSKLVPTFKGVYGGLFKYENNRAIYFNLADKIPELELKQCLKAALTYQKVKNTPLLGL